MKRASILAVPLVPSLIATLILAGPAAGRPHPGGSGCGPAWSTATTPNVTTTNFLYGIDAVTTSAIWAVGDHADSDELVQTMIQRWNGTTWSIVASPNVGTGDNSLNAVSMASTSAGWAVGGYISASDVQRTLVGRWNGTSWTAPTSPNVGAGDNVLTGVAALTSSDAWAVGHYFDEAASIYKTLILRWNGVAWSVVSSPNVGTKSNYLTGVSARNSTDIWAVGYREDPATGGFKSLILRWNGTTWSVMTSPNPDPSGDNVLSAVSALTSSAAWAVGHHTAGGEPQTFVAKWTGLAWATSPSPNPGTLSNLLRGVAATASGDVTSTGSYALAGVRQPLAVHWDGSAWSAVSTPPVGTPNSAFVNNDLVSVTTAGGQVWAAGYQFIEGEGIFTLIERLCPVQTLDSGFSPSSATINQGETVHWSVPASDTQNHTVTDDSGMALFGSGTKTPGTSYTFTFVGAGVYPVRDTLDGGTGTVTVPVTVTPGSGGVGTQFTVRWASVNAPGGFVYDTQIKRPGGNWVNWKMGKTNTKATFTPDSGTGTYSFRSRLHKLSGGATSNWSPAKSIVIS